MTNATEQQDPDDPGTVGRAVVTKLRATVQIVSPADQWPSPRCARPPHRKHRGTSAGQRDQAERGQDPQGPAHPPQHDRPPGSLPCRVSVD